MYVLSYVRPDRTAAVLAPVATVYHAAEMARCLLLGVPGEGWRSAEDARRALMDAPIASEVFHRQSGYILRIDPADYPPNVCGCCRGLVRPGDHAYAGIEDAYCLGCYTWRHDVPECLPQNTAHTECPEGHAPGGCPLCHPVTGPRIGRPGKEAGNAEAG